MLGFLLSIGDTLQQTKLDSFLEALFSTFIGFMVSLVTNIIVMPIMGHENHDIAPKWIVAASFWCTSLVRYLMARHYWVNDTVIWF